MECEIFGGYLDTGYQRFSAVFMDVEGADWRQEQEKERNFNAISNTFCPEHDQHEKINHWPHEYEKSKPQANSKQVTRAREQDLRWSRQKSRRHMQKRFTEPQKVQTPQTLNTGGSDGTALTGALQQLLPGNRLIAGHTSGGAGWRHRNKLVSVCGSGLLLHLLHLHLEKVRIKHFKNESRNHR